MLQATKNKYTVETLKPLNILYDHKHWLTQQDVDMANGYWKSHATLTLLAKQDCPLWLQYD